MLLHIGMCIAPMHLNEKRSYFANSLDYRVSLYCVYKAPPALCGFRKPIRARYDAHTTITILRILFTAAQSLGSSYLV